MDGCVVSGAHMQMHLLHVTRTRRKKNGDDVCIYFVRFKLMPVVFRWPFRT